MLSAIARVREGHWFLRNSVYAFRYGFRKGELLHATCGYFDPMAFTKKNKQSRVVDLSPDEESTKRSRS